MSVASPAGSKRVLLVDGDRRTSQRLADLLREDGYDVEVRCDGTSAMTRLSRAPLPDVLITELSVPLSDGANIARFGLAQRPDMQIVVLTRYANLPLPSAFGVPPPAVLSKPLDYAHLLELLQHSASTTADQRIASPAR